MTATSIIIGGLVTIEAARLSKWALARFGQWLDSHLERKRLRAQALAEARRIERSRLVEVGNAAKWRLLAQAGLLVSPGDGEVL